MKAEEKRGEGRGREGEEEMRAEERRGEERGGGKAEERRAEQERAEEKEKHVELHKDKEGMRCRQGREGR